MAVSIGVSVTGTKELKRALERMNPGTNKRILRNSLLEAAFMLQKDAATNQIRHGARKSPPIPGKLTNRHGGAGLVGSIRVNRGPLPFAIEVGTDKAYGARHEFGTRGMPRRPFLQPALDKIAPKFGDIVVKHWKKEAGL
jgi:HK97 gp10 family phage protein